MLDGVGAPCLLDGLATYAPAHRRPSQGPMFSKHPMSMAQNVLKLVCTLACLALPSSGLCCGWEQGTDVSTAARRHAPPQQQQGPT